MILILTERDDTHADAAVRRLAQLGAAHRRFDPAGFPERVRISFSNDARGCGVAFDVDGERISSHDVRAVWFRRPGAPRAPAAIADPVARTVAQQESAVFLGDLWETLECAWVPARPSAMRRWHKMAQLTLATQLGFALPPTLVTNDPEEFLAFYKACDGEVIGKRAGYSVMSGEDSPFCRFTEEVEPVDLVHLDAVALTPMIYQRAVRKAFELRITVVRDAVFAARIDSQSSARTRVDWRRYDHSVPMYRAFEMPPDEAKRCAAMIQAMGLTFGTLDVIVTPDGEFVFLEVNPNGQYLWVEYLTGLPITDAICDALTGASR